MTIRDLTETYGFRLTSSSILVVDTRSHNLTKWQLLVRGNIVE
jgi:hypothetical protein